MNKIRSLSQLLDDLRGALHDKDSVAVSTILDAFHERGFGALLLILAAPMALPVPVPPGINILLASPLILLTAQQALGAHTLWLPERWKSKTISRDKVEGLISTLIPWFNQLEVLTKPRLQWVTHDRASRFFGLLGLFMALSVCVPLPLTNTIPSFGIALMAIGTLMRDGVAVLVGALIGTAWVTMLLCAVLFFGPEAFDIVKEFIKSLL